VEVREACASMNAGGRRSGIGCARFWLGPGSSKSGRQSLGGPVRCAVTPRTQLKKKDRDVSFCLSGLPHRPFLSILFFPHSGRKAMSIAKARKRTHCSHWQMSCEVVAREKKTASTSDINCHHCVRSAYSRYRPVRAQYKAQRLAAARAAGAGTGYRFIEG
jgi:hypothetical protein